MRRHGVGQAIGIVDAGQRGQQFRRQLAIGLDVLLEQGQQGPGGCVELTRVTADDRRRRPGPGREHAIDILDGIDGHSTLAFDQNLGGAIRQLEQLQHLGHGADPIQIVGAGVIDVRAVLGNQHDTLVGRHYGIKGANGFLATDEQRNDHVWIDDDVAQWQHWQRLDSLGDACHVRAPDGWSPAHRGPMPV